MHNLHTQVINRRERKNVDVCNLNICTVVIPLIFTNISQQAVLKRIRWSIVVGA